MKRGSSEAILSAVFVDYDNIYLSLRRKNEEAAKRFAKSAGKWLAGLQSGVLITENQDTGTAINRRMVMNRCYGNPVPRRNQSDNSTDMNSFPFIRQHFLRNGFEIVDCPPLTAQLKNSSDIKMVMDLRDFLTHETYFDEFVILSSDADFTPVLHRLRAHNRRTVIFSNDNTAAPYTAIADAEVRESDLISLLMGDELAAEDRAAITQETVPEVTTTELASADSAPTPQPEPVAEQPRKLIIDLVAKLVREAPAPLPLEAAADQATRILGHDVTIATKWGGVGSFLELLRSDLPSDIGLSDQTPPVLYDENRVVNRRPAELAAPASETQTNNEPARAQPVPPEPEVVASAPEPIAAPVEAQRAPQIAEPAAVPPKREASQAAAEIQKSIARIHEASQAPPLSPPDYRVLFEEMADEITENQLQGVQTISNVEARTQARSVNIRREDIRFVLDVVGEADPWFENGASANIFAGRFRNFVVARCRGQGLSLSSDELELIETWFASAQPIEALRATPSAPAAASVEPETGGISYGALAGEGDLQSDDMPRIFRAQARH